MAQIASRLGDAVMLSPWLSEKVGLLMLGGASLLSLSILEQLMTVACGGAMCLRSMVSNNLQDE